MSPSTFQSRDHHALQGTPDSLLVDVTDNMRDLPSSAGVLQWQDALIQECPDGTNLTQYPLAPLLANVQGGMIDVEMCFTGNISPMCPTFRGSMMVSGWKLIQLMHPWMTSTSLLILL